MNHEASSCVGRVPLFGGLTPAEQEEVARFARPVRLARGEVAQRPGERGGTLLIVHSGALRVSMVGAGGQQQVLRVLHPGDFMGEVDFVTGAAGDRLAECLDDVSLCSFRHADLAELVRRFPGIGVRMLQTVTRRLAAVEESLTSVTGSGAAARIASYLLDLPAVRGRGATVVRLPVPKKDVASLLGITPETLSRRLADLRSGGLLEVAGSQITLLDVEGLARIANNH